MGETTQIEWADSTLNTAWGCTKVSAGCDNCYMYRLSRMFGRNPEIFQPRKIENIQKDIRKLGKEKRIVFLNSMTDMFHEDATDQLIEEWIKILENTPHTYIMLTKRVARMKKYFMTHKTPNNFWLGTSVENRAAYHRLTTLKKISCKTKFVSLEPLLESVKDINLEGIQWCIVGGESDNKNPRFFNDIWAIEARDACRKYNTKFFYKQSGGTKKNKGVWGTNVLDGKTYLEMPELLKTKQSTL